MTIHEQLLEGHLNKQRVDLLNVGIMVVFKKKKYCENVTCKLSMQTSKINMVLFLFLFLKQMSFRLI